MDLFSELYAIEFCSFASGSSGNCYYVGHGEGALLIDVGISARRIGKYLTEIGRNAWQIEGILLTHNHIDHISGLEALVSKHSYYIYATPQVAAAVQAEAKPDSCLKDAFKVIEPGKSFWLAGFNITPFEVSHDTAGAVGFYLRNGSSSLAFATDLGHIGPQAAGWLPQAEILILEANYDSHMLETGPYPAYLRQRISSMHGHLGNHQAAGFVAKHCRTKLRHLFLAHLSKENNHPEKAIHAFEQAFEQHDFDRKSLETLVCLERNKRSTLFRFSPKM
ncbi:MAG: MBL fold metallo-hydrolase [Bacteroidetes bacterium]|nr:MBL fold metallo-hydrolase [Bacteroidota bacterium]